MGWGWLSKVQKGRKFVVAAAALVLLVPGIVVVAETHAEHAGWENRPWGILEHVHKLFTHGLPPTPEWRCGYAHQIGASDGVLTVVPLLIGEGHQPLTLTTDWSDETAKRIPLDIEFAGFERVEREDDAHALARHHPTVFFIGFSSSYHRGPSLNERMEGFACANLAIVTDHTECAGAILAHEVGHVLGLKHSASGLMRPRDVGCEDRLLPEQTSLLLARFGPQHRIGVMEVDADDTPQGPQPEGANSQ